MALVTAPVAPFKAVAPVPSLKAAGVAGKLAGAREAVLAHPASSSAAKRVASVMEAAGYLRFMAITSKSVVGVCWLI